MKKITSENNFSYLFIALLTLLVSSSLLEQINIQWVDNLLGIIIFFVFTIGVHSDQTDRTWRWAVYFLAVLTVMLYFVHQLLSVAVADFLYLLLMLCFFAGSFYMSYLQIFKSKRVDRNMLIGSFVLYLLLGLIWTVIYLLLLMIYPDAFNGLEPRVWQENFSRVAYYSFVTLTTLGYGDISPKNSLAEFFVYFEAIVGVFYMAIIVSSLVSAALSQSKEETVDD